MTRLEVILETINQILSEGKGDKRGAGRKKNVKKARQRIKSDMKGLARVENEISDLEGVQDRFYTQEREDRIDDLGPSYNKIQDRIYTAKNRIAKRS